MPSNINRKTTWYMPTLSIEARRGPLWSWACCPLRSRACSWGPAGTTLISLILACCSGPAGTTAISRRRRPADIKSNNPHLTGGEKIELVWLRFKSIPKRLIQGLKGHAPGKLWFCYMLFLSWLYSDIWVCLKTWYTHNLWPHEWFFFEILSPLELGCSNTPTNYTDLSNYPIISRNLYTDIPQYPHFTVI